MWTLTAMSDWFDDNGYPTEDALERIQTFHGTPKELIEFISEVWWPQGAPGGTLRAQQPFPGGGSGWVWYQATGGWSGNEEIIDILRHTYFWMRFWYSEIRGGGYTFHIPEPDFHKAEYWGDLRFDPDSALRCPTCKHMWTLHKPDCRMGIGGGELCGCEATVNTVESPFGGEPRFVTEIEGIQLENVHPADNCAGEPCVIHNPTNHHMRSWRLIWRNDRKLFERQCPHGVGHPDPDQFAFWDKMSAARDIEIAKWMSQQDPADLAMMSAWDKPSNNWQSMGVHGCDGCCVGP